MKIAAVCITYNRPALLGRLIRCFEQQTLPLELRELVILDDAGQYPSQPCGKGWQVTSVASRFPSLGLKRKASIELISDDADAIAVWDDDDFYLPDALAACRRALHTKEWAQARHILEWDCGGREWIRQESHARKNKNSCAYHGAWSFRRAAFETVGGYPDSGSEDNPLADKLTKEFGSSGETECREFPDPWYVYSRGKVNGMIGKSGAEKTRTYHVSDLYQQLAKQQVPGFHAVAWDQLGEQEADKIQPVDEIPVGWDRDYLAIPMPKRTLRRPW
jgi:hypothetical protein